MYVSKKLALTLNLDLTPGKCYRIRCKNARVGEYVFWRIKSVTNMHWFLNFPEGNPKGEQKIARPHDLLVQTHEATQISAGQYECMKKLIWG
jgi:hypothetical protein